MPPITRLLDIMEKLRDPKTGCPWDVEQDFASIAPCTIEEAYEVVDAIAGGNRNELKEELGDLLLQVVFHSQMAKEEGSFSFDDVVDAIADKLVVRHPHVFGDATVDSAEAQETAWDALKEQERKAKGKNTDSLLDGITKGLPGMLRAVKLTKRAAKVGFDWQQAQDIFDKLEEEREELQEAMATPNNKAAIEEELGDMLFVCANLARHLKVDPEQAIAATNRKFDRRFRAMEALLADKGESLKGKPLDELDELWNTVKVAERKAA